MKNVHDCSSFERDKKELDLIQNNDCKGPTFTAKLHDHTESSFCWVYQFGQNSNDQFGMPQNAA